MNVDQYSEEEIIKGCVANKRFFQEVLFRKHFPAMMAMCMRYAQDQDIAMLIVNDGFLKVFKNIDSYSRKGSFEGWIRRICFRCLADYYRKDKKYVQFLIFEERDKVSERSALDKIYYQELIDLVDQLPSASAKVFRLYAIEGFKHAEIAEMLSISVGTSKWHLSEARKQMKVLINNYQTNVNYGR